MIEFMDCGYLRRFDICASCLSCQHLLWDRSLEKWTVHPAAQDMMSLEVLKTTMKQWTKEERKGGQAVPKNTHYQYLLQNLPPHISSFYDLPYRDLSLFPKNWGPELEQQLR